MFGYCLPVIYKIVKTFLLDSCIVTSFTKIFLCEIREKVCNVWIFSQLFIYKMDVIVTSGDYARSAFLSRNLVV